MPAILIIAFVLLLASPGTAQGTPPMDPEQRIQLEQENARRQEADSATAPGGTIGSLKKMAKDQINKAIMTPAKPGLKQWAPLTPSQKFQTFLRSTYAPQTFISAGLDAARAKSFSDNAAYERGVAGFAQHYGVEVATNETDVFFQKFLLPVVLRQDPRYFRNPDLPFFNRVVYSMSRVMITRTDRGHNTFNASLVLGAAASQAVSDIYVPGHQQGLWPIGRRIAFDLAIDSGFNLLNEFWPELRRKFFHR